MNTVRRESSSSSGRYGGNDTENIPAGDRYGVSGGTLTARMRWKRRHSTDDMRCGENGDHSTDVWRVAVETRYTPPDVYGENGDTPPVRSW
ncbi:hypothetical protein AVEN_62039-1 [Araneus ventricosus]|uniref:Uncharacterized protein n=1 Tax=Araneus ventricosus TaxID=182803 RepID=A0A4Y2JDZ9_ARAVE|nr:hypothetical protein AVEN_62039-1 [Araneus ventricosus]